MAGINPQAAGAAPQEEAQQVAGAAEVEDNFPDFGRTEEIPVDKMKSETTPEQAAESAADQTAGTPADQIDDFGQDLAETPTRAERMEAAAQADNSGLPDDIKEMFSYFIPIPGMTDQISQVLDSMVKSRNGAVTSSTGNLIVQGEEGSGKTMLATDLIKATQKTMGTEDEKIGKISAEALNKRNFASLIPKIAGGFLIVEDAGQLSPETIATMSQVMDQETGGMTVVIEDDSEGIRRVTGQNPAFAAKFTEKIKIPIFTIDELVDFGKAYALEQECEIEEMAVLALYNRISNIQKLDHPTTLTEVKEIVDAAIDSAESGGIKKLFAKKYNEEDYLILHEEDFE